MWKKRSKINKPADMLAKIGKGWELCVRFLEAIPVVVYESALPAFSQAERGHFCFIRQKARMKSAGFWIE